MSEPTIQQQRKGAGQVVVDVICSRWLPQLLGKAVQTFEHSKDAKDWRYSNSVEERDGEWVFMVRLRVPKEKP